MAYKPTLLSGQLGVQGGVIKNYKKGLIDNCCLQRKFVGKAMTLKRFFCSELYLNNHQVSQSAKVV